MLDLSNTIELPNRILKASSENGELQTFGALYTNINMGYKPTLWNGVVKGAKIPESTSVYNAYIEMTTPQGEIKVFDRFKKNILRKNFGIAFDTNGRETIVWEEPHAAYMHFFNDATRIWETRQLELNSHSPCVSIDSLNPNTTNRDVTVSYIVDDKLYVRFQSQRFQIQNIVPNHTVAEGEVLHSTGVDSGWRFTWKYKPRRVRVKQFPEYIEQSFLDETDKTAFSVLGFELLESLNHYQDFSSTGMGSFIATKNNEYNKLTNTWKYSTEIYNNTVIAFRYDFSESQNTNSTMKLSLLNDVSPIEIQIENDSSNTTFDNISVNPEDIAIIAIDKEKYTVYFLNSGVQKDYTFTRLSNYSVVLSVETNSNEQIHTNFINDTDNLTEILKLLNIQYIQYKKYHNIFNNYIPLF